MKRGLWTVVLGVALAAAGVVWAQGTKSHDAMTHGGAHGETVRVVSERDLKEKLDGKDTAATVVEVTFEPGGTGAAHRHPGPAIVYVLEGEYELGIDDKPTEFFKAGQTFYEPGGCLHRVSRNPSKEHPTRLIAVVLHPRDAKEIVLPEHTPDAQH